MRIAPPTFDIVVIKKGACKMFTNSDINGRSPCAKGVCEGRCGSTSGCAITELAKRVVAPALDGAVIEKGTGVAISRTNVNDISSRTH
tara:strand:+ start:441 stop:704 length:264 start_codon:yes stop_codon:yes gene_type:complete